MTDMGLAAVADNDEDENWDGPEQHQFDEADYTKIKFVGVEYNSLTMEPKIGDEVTFMVRGRISEVGDRALKDGHVQHFAKCDVKGVTRPDEDGDG